MTVPFKARLEGVETKDTKLQEFLASVADTLDRLNANFILGSKESEVMVADRKGYDLHARANVANILPDVLIVKSLRFQEDRHGLLLSSAESMGCRVRRSADLSIPNNAWTPINYDLELWDTDDMFIIANNFRITFNHEGKYIVGARGIFEADAVGDRGLQLLKNGVTSLDLDVRPAIATAGLGTSVICVTEDYFVINDYIECHAFQNTGAPLNLLTVSAYSPVLWAHRSS